MEIMTCQRCGTTNNTSDMGYCWKCKASLFAPIVPLEIPLKAWAGDEAIKEGVERITIYHRIYRGKYPNLPLKRLNKRVIFVEVDKMMDWAGIGAHNDWL